MATKPSARRDLRLLPPALGVYAGCWSATGPSLLSFLGQPWVTVLAAALLVLVVTAVCAAASPRLRALRLPALLLLAGLVVGFAVGALRVGSDGQSTLRALAKTGQQVHFEGVIQAAASAGGHVHDDRRTQEMERLTVRLSVVTANAETWRVAAPVTVLAPPNWGQIAVGSTIAGSGQLQPSLLAADEVVLRVRRSPHVLAAPSRMTRTVAAFRRGMQGAVAGLPSQPRGLLPGLVLGDTSGLDPELKADFQTTGLTHLVAVSGGNLAIVSAAVLGLLLWFHAPRRAAIAAAGIALLGYVVVVGPDPSVLRAGVMAAITLLGLVLGRGRDTLAALLAAAALLLLAEPGLARSYGFVLSVLATAGLLTWAGPWTRALTATLRRRIPPGGRLARHVPVLAAALAVPAAAQLAVAPVLVLLQPSVSLVSVPANLVAAAAVVPATLLGLVTALLAPLCLPLAEVVAWFAQWPADVIVTAATTGARLPAAAVPWLPGVGGAAMLAAVLVLLALALRVGRLPRVRSHLAPLAAVAVPLLVTGGLVTIPGVTARRDAPWPPPDWSLIACDVGQGDGLLVRTPADDSVAVVDTGPDPAAMRRCLQRVGVRRISLLLLTHLHADHVEGVPGVLQVARPQRVLVGPLDEPASEGRRVQQWLAADHVRAEPVPVGQRLVVEGTTWDFLWPRRVIPGDEGSEPNNASAVTVVRTPQLSLLLTGDVEPEAQRAVRQDVTADVGPDGVDVLKVPHHGSAHQDEPFLAAAEAKVAVISVGVDNDYGHPAPVTLEALRSLGMRVERTDQDGGVAVLRRGGQLLVSTERPDSGA